MCQPKFLLLYTFANLKSRAQYYFTGHKYSMNDTGNDLISVLKNVRLFGAIQKQTLARIEFITQK